MAAAEKELSTDICIVGGGPAGLALALLLLKSGVRVTLLERAVSLDREFRGEILQPGGMAVLDGLGVLDAARSRGAYQLDRFQLTSDDRILLNIDYRQLGAPYDHLLSIPQPHLLTELLAHCQERDGFHYLSGTRASELLRQGERVIGVVGRSGDGTRWRVRAHCVVGADGRYSKVRQLAGIATDRIDMFDQDVLWCRIKAPGRRTGAVRIHRSTASPVLLYDSYPDCLQIGWTLPHGGYREVVDRGVDAVRSELTRALPSYADLINAQITDMKDFTLLDVFACTARQWSVDGLVLIGDSAHTHSPLGAQGINLALQDAALLHPILVESLAVGDASADFLDQFAQRRRPDIDRVMKVQQMQSKGMLSRSPVADFIRPKAAKLISRTPIGKKITKMIAFGPTPVHVRQDLFVSVTSGRR
ncbi:MAG: FAD-binding monooxygenase [Actinobacteria bacterium]|nr:MAG: FAD-binding monooxygenase [Actinomycetota bacterium]